jgi:peptidylprolyl isomerase
MYFPRLFVSAILLAFAVAPLSALAAGEVTTPSGLRIIDVKVGTGPVPQAGQVVTVNYTGWLFVDGKKGKKFDSSLDRGQPISFTLGQGQVIKGWDEGLATMHVGGQRTLIIPPDLGYGASGAGGVIPPGATLIFEVDLLGAK